MSSIKSIGTTLWVSIFASLAIFGGAVALTDIDMTEQELAVRAEQKQQNERAQYVENTIGAMQEEFHNYKFDPLPENFGNSPDDAKETLNKVKNWSEKTSTPILNYATIRIILTNPEINIRHLLGKNVTISSETNTGNETKISFTDKTQTCETTLPSFGNTICTITEKQ